MNIKREIINITPYLSAPLVYDYVLENQIYEHCFDKEGNPIDSEDWKFWDDFEWISEEIIDVDYEKAYSNKITIIKRKSTNQYFKAKWCDCPYSYSGREYPTELVEVFPKQTITYE